MIRLSDPNKSDFVPLTRGLLDPKSKSNDLPFFDPDIDFHPKLRKLIQDMPYNKRLDVFFNENKYDSTILHYGGDVKREKKNQTRNVDNFLSTIDKSLRVFIQSTYKKEGLELINARFLTEGFNQDVAKEQYGILQTELDRRKTSTILHEKDSYKKFVKELNKVLNAPMSSQIVKNFEFMIQTLLCTGFPVQNYHRTMEFYDPDISNKKLTVKSSNGFLNTKYLKWIPDLVLSKRFSPCFSYIHQDSKIYTVTGVRWINDALNHPKYNEIISAYKKYQLEKKNSSENNIAGKVKEELDRLLYTFIIQIKHNVEIWNDDKLDQDKARNRTDRRVISRSENDSFIIREKLNQLFQDIHNDSNAFFGMSPEPVENHFYKEYTEFKNVDSANLSEPQKKMTLQELMVKYKDTIITKENGSVKTSLENFLKDGQINDFKKRLSDMIDELSRRDIRLYSVPYAREIVTKINKIKPSIAKNEIYNIVNNNIDYRDRDEKEVKEIEELLKQKFPNYRAFSDAMVGLYNERRISNPHWKSEAKKFLGKSSGILQKKSEKKESTKGKGVFETLIDCDDNNASCKKRGNNNTFTFLDVGIDELKTSQEYGDKTAGTGKNISRSFEAYVHLDVVQGQITPDNFSDVFCSYTGNILGDYWERDENVKGENYILKDTVFMDLTEVIKKAEQKNQKNPSAKKNTRKNLNTKPSSKTRSIPKKEGGSGKTHRRIKKRPSSSSTRKRFT